MKTIVILALFASSVAVAQKSTPYWMSQKYRVAIASILKNINPTGKEPGTVIASPQTSAPNYFFHWVRDGALVMNPIIDLYLMDTNIGARKQWQRLLIEYAARARKHQTAKAKTGLGEPKFNIDGTAFDGPWGRPQYDGPALRAAVLSRLAAVWMQQGRRDLVSRHLWNPKSPKTSVIKTDLDFLLKVWTKPSFDLWEELNGIHFFTAIVQRKAFKLGSRLARSVGDYKSAMLYSEAYRRLTASMERFWAPYARHYVSTISRVGGIDYKYSNIDSSIFVGANFAEIFDGSVGQIDDPRLIRTFAMQEKVFGEIYLINQNRKLPPMIGRYPEDKYNGSGNSRGNPWFITTHAFGEYLYKLASYLRVKGAVKVGKLTFDFYSNFGVKIKEEELIDAKDKRFNKLLAAIYNRADAYLLSAQKHTGPAYRMSEQINRDTGFQQGAVDLTWSYASYVTAYFARHRFYQVMRSRM